MAKPTCAYIDPRTDIRCHRVPRYLHRLTIHGTANPRNVLLCDTCDKQEGRKTLTERHGWSLDDAIKWERDPARTVSLNGSSPLTPQAIRSQTMAHQRGSHRTYAINTLY